MGLVLSLAFRNASISILPRDAMLAPEMQRHLGYVLYFVMCLRYKCFFNFENFLLLKRQYKCNSSKYNILTIVASFEYDLL